MMRYRLLGHSGLRVSELALGTMTFGEDWGWGASQAESRRIFDAYVAAGGNFIDTACNYTNGTSEHYVGEFVLPERDRFVVATKYTLSMDRADPNAGGNHRKNMVHTVERSLKNLGSDYIDLLWLHVWDYTTPVEEVMRGLDDLVAAGKVLYVGVSDTPAWVVSQANTLAELRGWSRFVALQLPYSLAERTPERDLLPMARAHDLAVTCWGLLGGGALTGKYNRDTDEPRRYDETSADNKRLAAEVMRVAEEIGHTPSQVAINWVRQQTTAGTALAPVLIPILGARSVAQIEDNLGVLEFALDEAHLARLAEASAIDLGFPHSFGTNKMVRGLIFGETFDRLDNHHR
jgi:aryl-alcohol dehydrogenase-like predicted oxidoreductase